MPSPRKYFVNNSAVFVSTRTEEGLPFVPTEFMNLIIWGILAKAQSLYPRVTVCSFLFMLNHFHMLIVVDDPEQVSPFIGYIKQETSHCVNRMLGRRQKTIWKAEYDSPTVLDHTKVLDVLTYIYTNPIAAGLVCHIDEYPAVSSWELMKNQRHISWHYVFTRDSIPKLQNPVHPDRENSKVCQQLVDSSKTALMFRFDPFAWKKCFDETKNIPDSELMAELVDRIREKEKEYEAERIRTKSFVAGDQSLISASMLRQYTPKKFGRRMICLASDRRLRVHFITFFKAISKKAKEIFYKWKKNDFSGEFPVGLFMPPYPRTLNRLKEFALEDVSRVPSRA